LRKEEVKVEIQDLKEEQKCDDTLQKRKNFIQRMLHSKEPMMKKKASTLKFFDYILSNKSFMEIRDNKVIENLSLLEVHRKKDNIYYISSNKFSLVALRECGFNCIPVSKFEEDETDTAPLRHLETYILSLRYSKNRKQQNLKDFDFLNNDQNEEEKEEEEKVGNEFVNPFE